MESLPEAALYIPVGLILGLIPAFIAKYKGRSFFGWWIFGFLILIVALPCSFLVRNLAKTKCPECAETVKVDARRCWKCGRTFAEGELLALAQGPANQAYVTTWQR